MPAKKQKQPFPGKYKTARIQVCTSQDVGIDEFLATWYFEKNGKNKIRPVICVDVLLKNAVEAGRITLADFINFTLEHEYSEALRAIELYKKKDSRIDDYHVYLMCTSDGPKNIDKRLDNCGGIIHDELEKEFPGGPSAFTKQLDKEYEIVYGMKEVHEKNQSFLNEGRVEDLTKKYPNLDVKEIAENDPSPNKKYVAWMCKQLASGVSENDLYPTIKSFDKNVGRIKNKDINSYKTAKDLENVIKALTEKSNKKQKEETKSAAPKIYEDENMLIVRPDDKNSCMVYGSGTKWCITMKDESYYEQYTSKNVVFYYLIRKNVEAETSYAKIALAVVRNDDNSIKGAEIYDAEDNLLSDAEATRKSWINKKLQEPFPRNLIDLCLSDAKTRPQSFLSKLNTGTATEEEQLYELDKLCDEDTRFRIAEKTKSPVILEKLSTDKSLFVRQEVAKNLFTSQEILEVLMRDVYEVASKVGLNKNASPEILDALTSRPGSMLQMKTLRRIVCTNKNTTVKTLIKLSDSDDASTKQAIANNPNTPVDIVVGYLKDSAYAVADAAANSLCAREDTPTKILGQMNNQIRISIDAKESLAKNPKTPIANLHKLMDVIPTRLFPDIAQLAKKNLQSRKFDENMTTQKEPLNELKFNLLGKLFAGALGAWMVGKVTNIKLRGTQHEIKTLANAMVASKAFQDELRKPGATIDSVVTKLGIKNMTAQQVKNVLGIDFPL